MLIKESEAANFACPMGFSGAGGHGFSPCVGKSCMAWRSVKSQAGEVGYCGMAGMPAEVNQALISRSLAPALALAGISPGEPGRIMVPS